jgi:excisionase family DNA binding protein
MESATRILTITEVAEVLRCSKAHVHNALTGRIAGVSQMAHLRLGRRKLVPKDWFDQWLQESRAKAADYAGGNAEAGHGTR